MEFDYIKDVPAVCANWAIDVLARGAGAGQIERTFALDGLRAAMTSRPGYVTQAACRVNQCPVRCNLYSGDDPLGNLHIVGAASEEGITDLSNCIK